MIFEFIVTNQSNVKQTSEFIEMMGKRSFWFVLDVSDEQQVEEAAAQVRTKIGDIDILVNNAGIAPCEPFKELTSEKVKQVFDTNIMAHFWVIYIYIYIYALHFFV